MMPAWIGLTPLVLAVAPLLGQTSVQGNALVTLADDGTDCNGYGVRVAIIADVTGLTGQAGAAVGINAFGLELGFDRLGALAFSDPGSGDWSMLTTIESMVTTDITLVGWWPEPNAPNAVYHLATAVFSGTQGPLTVALGADSEIASRFVSEDNGPDLIPFQTPPAILVQIPRTFDLHLSDAIPAWRGAPGVYDFAAPLGTMDVLDLVKFLRCAP